MDVGTRTAAEKTALDRASSFLTISLTPSFQTVLKAIVASVMLKRSFRANKIYIKLASLRDRLSMLLMTQ